MSFNEFTSFCKCLRDAGFYHTFNGTIICISIASYNGGEGEIHAILERVNSVNSVNAVNDQLSFLLSQVYNDVDGFFADTCTVSNETEFMAVVREWKGNHFFDVPDTPYIGSVALNRYADPWTWNIPS